MTSSSLDLIEIFLVIFLLNLNKHAKNENGQVKKPNDDSSFEHDDKKDAFDDDTENKPDDHSSFDNRRKKSNMIPSFGAGQINTYPAVTTVMSSLSTGYMSEETYELPETRPESMESTLENIDEVSAHNNQEMFTLAIPSTNSSFNETSLPVQMEVLDSSSSGSIPDNLELASVLDPVTNHEVKHSGFDSDGTYMMNDGQSSDSGAALIQHFNLKTKKERQSSESRIIKGSRKRFRKAKNIIRSNEEFFMVYDNKHWTNARKICFWFSILSILGSIIAAAILIVMMPRSCDPVTAWWQRNVILDIIPMNSTNSEPKINLTDLIFNVPKFKEIGIQALKLKNIYRQTSHQYASKPFQGEHRATVAAVANIVTHAIVDIAFENTAGQTEFKKDDQSAFNGHIESNTVNRNETVPEDIQNFYSKIDAVDDEEDAINTSPQEIGCSYSIGDPS